MRNLCGLVDMALSKICTKDFPCIIIIYFHEFILAYIREIFVCCSGAAVPVVLLICDQ